MTAPAYRGGSPPAPTSDFFENPASVEDWCRCQLGELTPESEPHQFRARCPLHGDKRPSLAINTSTGEAFCRSADCTSALPQPHTLYGLAQHLDLPLAGLVRQRRRRRAAAHQSPTEYIYRRANGENHLRVTRKPGPSKSFFQSHWNGTEWVSGLKRADGSKTPRIPYALDHLANDPEKQPVLWTEGEKDSDRAGLLGVLATTSPGGASQARHLDRESLNVLSGRRVVIVPDNDEPGSKYARDIRRLLEKAGAHVTIRELDGVGEGGDLSDWLDLGNDIQELFAPQDPTEEGAPKRLSGSHLDKLLQLGEHLECFHCLDGQTWVSLDGVTAEPINSTTFETHLVSQFFLEEGRAPSTQSVNDGVRTYAAKAACGPCYPVFVRLGSHEGRIYLDRGEEGVLEISADGWRETTTCPVKFRRPRGLRALPRPERGGSLEELEQFINFKDRGSFILVAAWLLSVLMDYGARPILQPMGEQGAGKSTLSRMLVSLLDPKSVPLRMPPRDERSTMIQAVNSLVMAFDNMSRIPQWMSDCLCSLVTGGGHSERKLHTDTEESLFTAQRSIILNGIELALKPDLADRAVVVCLEAIPDTQRTSDRVLWERFEAARPRLLGCLLDAAAAALKNRPQVELERKPRMADFAEFVVAAEPALPWEPGEFLAAYSANQEQAVRATLDGDNLAEGIRATVELDGRWRGTATELLERLRTDFPGQEWPKNARSLSSRVRRLATFLRKTGIDIEFEATGSARLLKLSSQRSNEPQDWGTLI